MTPTPCPATTLFRHRSQTIEYRCELDAGHQGLHRDTSDEGTVMWGAAESAGGES